jgi:hypothetical protein
MTLVFRSLAFMAAVVAALLPHRHWRRLPSWVPVDSAAFLSGILTIFLGTAVGIPGFLEHAGLNVSFINQAVVDEEMRNPKAAGYSRGMVQGFAGLSIFTFLLLTPAGWLTMYLMGSGGIRAAGGWFDDPVGDPILTLLDHSLFRRRERRREMDAKRTREALEGPEIADRVVSNTSAGIPGCDLVIVASRRKPGWERGVVVFTASTVYRIGEPVERTIAGRLRTLYPLSEHKDLEAVRKSVEYDLPTARTADASSEPGRTTADRAE